MEPDLELRQSHNSQISREESEGGVRWEVYENIGHFYVEIFSNKLIIFAISACQYGVDWADLAGVELQMSEIHLMLLSPPTLATRCKILIIGCREKIC